MNFDPSLSVCPVCRNAESRLYLAGEEKVLDMAAMGSSRKDHSHGTINRCQVCRHAFRVKRPSPTELAELYRGMSSDIYEAETVQRRRTAVLYFDLVTRRMSGRTGTLLDVGCGSGLFLDTAARAGWKIAGVEPSTKFFQAAEQRLAGRGQLVNATLQEAGLATESFDAITVWDVIEHVDDPAGLVELCASLLKPGGVLFMKAPDIDSLQARVMRGRWPVLLPEHLHYFTRESLRICGDRAALSPPQFSRHPVFFSLGYVLYRLSQHRIAGARLLNRMVSRSALSRVYLRLHLGELHVAWMKPPLRQQDS